MNGSDSPTRAEQLAGQIADAILKGEFAPGTKLDEHALALRYSVSRTPVREALRQLGATGLIETRPRRGATVAHITSEQLEILFVERGEDETYAEANVAFHSAIYAGTHNAIIEDIAIGLRRRLLPFRRAQFRAPDRLRRSHLEHAAVVEAVRKGDAAAAHAAMLHHVSLVEDAFDEIAHAKPAKTSP